MATGTAPARRLAIFLSDDTAATLTPAGLTLLDNAITWTTNNG